MNGKRASFALIGGVALAIGLGGCGKSGGTGGDAASVTSAIKADEKAMNGQIKANDLEGLAGHYAADAYFLAPGAPPSNGSTEIRKLWSGALNDKNFKLSFASDKVEPGQSGDLAYARGRYTEQYTDPKTSKVMTNSGSYLSVYKKQPDGSWKMVEDFAAAGPDPAREVPPAKPAQRARMVSF